VLNPPLQRYTFDADKIDLWFSVYFVPWLDNQIGNHTLDGTLNIKINSNIPSRGRTKQLSHTTGRNATLNYPHTVIFSLKAFIASCLSLSAVEAFPSLHLNVVPPMVVDRIESADSPSSLLASAKFSTIHIS